MIDTIIFDLGGVLIDWNPKYLYRKLFRSELAVDYFLENITSSDWNEQQDAGRSLQFATNMLAGQYPEYGPEIKAYYGRWEEDMLGGAKEETVAILESFIHHPGFRVYALTNWSAETFPIAQKKFEFLEWFDGIVVSGEEKIKKPDPEIYHIILERYRITPEKSLFIDDSERNIRGAAAMGIQGIHFQDASALKMELHQRGLLP